MYGNEDQKETQSLEDAFEQELSSLKDQTQKRFEWIPINIDCLNFCKTVDPLDPVAFVKHLIRDLEANQKKKTRYTCRLLPIQKVCQASMAEIKKICEGLFEPVFGAPDQPAIKVRAFSRKWLTDSMQSCPRFDIIVKSSEWN